MPDTNDANAMLNRMCEDAGEWLREPVQKIIAAAIASETAELESKLEGLRVALREMTQRADRAEARLQRLLDDGETKTHKQMMDNFKSLRKELGLPALAAAAKEARNA